MAIITPVNQLTLNTGDATIEVKIYRTWAAKNPPDQRPKGYCCLLLDIEGHAIQANMSCRDFLEHFNKVLKLHSAYRISNFFCTPTNEQQQTVPNPISITLGRIANIKEIEAANFPDHYFRFVSYSQLAQRLEQNSILTDYMGCIQHVGNQITHGTLNTSQKIQRDLQLINLSGDVIRVTLWNDQATNFNADEYEVLEKPVIVAVTSCWVNRNYGGTLKLTSSPATYCYFNPPVPDFFQSINAYRDLFAARNLLPVDRNKYEDRNIEKLKNRYTLTALLQQHKESYEGVSFTCELTLLEFDDTRTWYYNSCDDPKCRKQLLQSGNTQKCPTHGNKPDNFCFCFRAYFTDGPATTAFTFFSEKGDALIGQSCHNLVTVLGYKHKKIIPPEMRVLEGTKHILQFHYSSSTDRGLAQFIVDDVFPIDPDYVTDTHQQQQEEFTITPSKPEFYTESASETPSTTTISQSPSTTPGDDVTKTTKRVLFDESAVPATNTKRKKD